MSTSQPASPALSEHAASVAARFQSETVREVAEAVASSEVVVVGMGWNPHVRRACRALDSAGVAYRYLGYGNYLMGWKPRLGIKLWSGWPTFPQVFVNGVLVGGNRDLADALADGTLERLRAEGRKSEAS